MVSVPFAVIEWLLIPYSLVENPNAVFGEVGSPEKIIEILPLLLRCVIPA
ncbi:MAG: hypothetical protein ACJATA_000189 [Sphingobacteriales bacterium]|jgi:hypothetical protein